MALKDWKKIMMKDEWLNTTKKYHSIIIVDKNTSGNWNFIVGSASGNRECKRMFKTKSQALKFAKSYMRTH